MKKIFKISELSKKIAKHKLKKKIIVHCHGVFDVLHAGHIKHFNSAKRKGDILLVTVTPDDYVNKGPNRPIFGIDTRMACIAALDCVDYVCASNSPDAIPAIKILKPNIYCKGKDYIKNAMDITGKIKKEKDAIRKVGGKIFYTQDELYSSSRIINHLGFNMSSSQKKYIDKLKLSKNFKGKNTITESLDLFKRQNVLVIGELIIDEYIYTEALGKSGKEPVLVLRDLYTEKYLGGVAAIAKNLFSFCKKIKILSYIGEKKEHEKFINQNIPKKIIKQFILKKNSTTIVKRRFVDNVNRNKILGIHSINDHPLDTKQKNYFKKIVNKDLKKYDLVIVSDYGHGLISNEIAKVILKKSKFVAVNAQLNAANTGYHTISKYVGADLIIINENEMRHELRNKIDSVDKLIKVLGKKLKSKYLAVTSGNQGSRIFSRATKKIHHCPAFADKVTDKIGTGDTMLALLAISIFKKINIKFSMFLSALGAAENIKHMANSVSIKKNNMIKSLESYIK